MRETSHSKLITLIGGLGLSLLTTHLSVGSDQPRLPDLPDRQAGSQEQAGLSGMKADLKIILQDRFGRL